MTKGDDNTRRYERLENRVRDTVLFMIGVAGTINELWVVPDPRPYALAFLSGLLGLPFILHADAMRRSRNLRNMDDNNDSDKG